LPVAGRSTLAFSIREATFELAEFDFETAGTRTIAL
jgi:hypothetical protein